MAKKSPVIAVTRMPWQQWVKVPDNPRQRDTERRAGYSKRRHLSELKPAHHVVFACGTKDKIVCKADGHTRAYLWESGQLDLPIEPLTVIVVSGDPSEIYGHMDSPQALEKSPDRLFGGLRQSGIRVSSPLLVPCKFSLALRIADGQKASFSQGATEYDLVARWREEIADVDSWGLPAGSLPAPLLAAAFLATCRDGQRKARKFFAAVAEADPNDISGTEPLGVRTMVKELARLRAEDKLSGWVNITALAAYAVAAYEIDASGRPAIDPLQYPKPSEVLAPIVQQCREAHGLG